jgi:ATP-dependent protease ClpP protease subunit
MENKKPNEISSENHTLFIKNVPEFRRTLDRYKNIVEIRPKHKVYTVYIEKFKELKRGLHSVLNELRSASIDDKLEFRINSGGGFVNEGQQFYNLIHEKFHDRTTAYLDNHGYSMGALLFCMADKRVIYPYSDLMFHNYSSGVGGKGGEIISRIEHTDKHIKAFFRKVIVEKGFLSDSEFENMLIGQDYWMGAKELCQRKIATHVVYKGKEIKAKKYLKILKKEAATHKER